jgi:ATP-dependent RNA helicase RhlE
LDAAIRARAAAIPAGGPPLVRKNLLRMTSPTFVELGVAEPICRALSAEGYETPTPIQARAIPSLLEGRDLLGLAQTGTGKTAAFSLPILQKLSSEHQKRSPRAARALILAPTRELAIQIGESLQIYGRHLHLRHTVIFGGVSQFRQVKAMAQGVDILVATPGRLLDLMNQKHIRLDETRTLVLDEADRMLDMGFVHDVKKIIAALPRERQSLLFSATMPKSIESLAAEILKHPARVEVTPEVVTVDRIDQHVLYVDQKRKRELLSKLLENETLSRVIVFTRTKHCANRVSEQLEKAGVPSGAIHGNKSQNARQKALDEFRTGRSRVLVATDIAARGIDVDGVTHVVNYELPNEPESYVHRIGRTARAGASGIALSFCDASERSHLRSIERLTKKPLTVFDTRSLLGESAAHEPQPGGEGRGQREARQPRGERKPGGERRHNAEHKARGEHRTDGEHKARGEHRTGGEHRAGGDRKPGGERKAGGDRKPGEHRHGKPKHHHGRPGDGEARRPEGRGGKNRNRPGSRARKRQHAAAQ